MISRWFPLFAFVCGAVLAGAAVAEPQMKTESFANTKDGFAAISRRIESGSPRNLLARRGVRVFGEIDSAKDLVDGAAGSAYEQGRVFLNAQPAIVTFYLGQARPIHEIGVFSFNGDSRANQDFEVRLADNSAHPGQAPRFTEAPTCTTGPKILGANGGGFHTSFASPDGKPLARADWVEFRIWRTYPSKAGDAARTGKINGAAVVIELAALGAPDDVVVISPEERARTTMLREMGDRPPFERRATWYESMMATREAILAWENDVDQLVLERAGVTLGPWKTLGSIPADGDLAKQVERLGTVDLGKPLAINKTPLAWQPCAIKDGELANLAAMTRAAPGSVVVLCRELSLVNEFAGREGLGVGIGASAGKFRVVGGHSTISFADRLGGPNEVSWGLHEKAGKYHVLAMLPVSKDGQCDLWFMVQPAMNKPGAGSHRERADRRRNVYNALRGLFKDDISQLQIKWEQTDSIAVRFERRSMAGREWFPTDWAPGKPLVLIEQYNLFAAERLAKIEKELATIEPAIRDRVQPWLERAKASPVPAAFEQARARYYGIALVQEAMAEHHKIESMRLAVLDQQKTFGEKYPDAAAYLKRIDALEQQMLAAWPSIASADANAMTALTAASGKIASEGQQILLANPVLAFEKLLLGKGGPGFASNWGGPNNIGSEIVTLSPIKPDGSIATVYKGKSIHDMDLSFDARKILFSESHRIHEVNSDGSDHRQITNHEDKHTRHYDACRLPNGKIMFVSTACEQAVPCTGEWYVGNMHLIDPDGKNERRLCFDQDHNWNPCVLNNGQVIYTRWEYTDTPHYFTRLLFTMNPDGSNQTEFYGSNSYWPNAMYWPRPIPGHPSRIVCIVSGHHGVSRVGQMVILDTSQGRHEADGVVQRIGERGKRVEPVIEDGLVAEWWPRFAYPWPLAEPGTNRGAGKYFLANMKPDEHSPWGVYLVDVFDNMTPVLIGSCANPIPLQARATPPIVPDRVDPRKSDALVYMVDVNRGGGLKGFPKGAVKSLRVGSHVYRYGGNGDTYGASYEGGWDPKRILGTVPVEPDGSAFFKVPANTPIFVQPLDEQGRALAVMRSWFTAMPGETLSCVGCHEQGRETAPSIQTIAARRPASEIAPWHGPARGFGFEHEVQPVLDRKCAGCHDGSARPDNLKIPDFRNRQLRTDKSDRYSPAYMALAPYVRRPGYESDYHLNAPAEWHISTSPLFQMLDKGHHNVQLSREDRDRLYTWIDMNVPYAASWSESHRPPEAEQVERRARYNSLFANVKDCTEQPLALPPVGKFDAPAPEAPRPAAMKIDGWPIAPEQAATLQQQTGLRELTFDLGDGVTMALVPIPAGKFVMGDVAGFGDEFPQAAIDISQPFYIGKLEVTNRQYARFDPRHDSAYIDARGKDRFTRGYPANEPDQPVIRITWHEAMSFCRWLSEKTGCECTLPTEAQWEYACRAGSATAWSFGDSFQKQSNLANTADNALAGWAWGRVDRDYSDGARFSIPGGKYKPNAWGVFDMHGNVAEWTRSDYKPYPYAEKDRNSLDPLAPKAVRGGSWNDTLRYSRSASRLGYLPCQPVYNVGFRIVCKPARIASAK